MRGSLIFNMNIFFATGNPHTTPNHPDCEELRRHHDAENGPQPRGQQLDRHQRDISPVGWVHHIIHPDADGTLRVAPEYSARTWRLRGTILIWEIFAPVELDKMFKMIWQPPHKSVRLGYFPSNSRWEGVLLFLQLSNMYRDIIYVFGTTPPYPALVSIPFSHYKRNNI